MAENSSDQEKTEDPTPKRLQQAREKGQVPRSKEMGTAFVLMGAAIAMMIFGQAIAQSMISLATSLFSRNRAQVFDVSEMTRVFGEIVMAVGLPVLGFVVFLTVAAFVGNTLLGGMTFSWKAAAPKMNKFNPINGFKRMFGVQAVVELVKAVAKFAVVAVVAWMLLTIYFEDIMALSTGTTFGAIAGSVSLLNKLFTILCCSLMLIVIIDAPYQIWNHTKQLKMTKQEIKDEHKDSEGKPEVKGRIRQLQREMSQRRMMSEVPQADVVVVNPTHYSVALKYDKAKARAPLVVAKGTDEVALKIREIAREYEVPVISSPQLARAVYYSTKLNKQIPDGLFTAVAQILAYVFQLKQFQKGRSGRPVPLPNTLPIPDELQMDSDGNPLKPDSD
ncbi:flagellar biosynthesis protein FlhB [Ferrimonas sp. SCSIO 43195]|uniref:flagellar biosynthesis protein FlhB n=1 Tax=Ferrimonas sp. SCSIO 43195 TaxID=2822844 RepID=UPI0020761BA7|nr:flagellar biosynthesis protein FlhB [Ferrimonas sp. SCSIO 43195]USD38638.1 flagellar biosynthesis protein FlhB [Ferrimonas sp. SCSIO 43195]